jgi:hypothetical protein
MANPVAKHMPRVSKPRVFIDRKKQASKQACRGRY